MDNADNTITAVKSSAATGSPWWWDAAPPRLVEDPLPAEVDVTIVGAGFTGLSAALYLLRAGLSVALIEQSRPGEGASSRNGGMLGHSHKVGYGALRNRFGHETAQRILQEGMASLAFTQNLIAQEKIVCDYQPCGRFRGAWTTRDYDAMASDIEWMQLNVGLNASMLTRAEQHREVNTDRYQGGCVFHDHGSVHPGLLHAGLLDRVIQAGGVISSRNSALSITTDKSRKKLTTAHGDIRSRHIVLATNGYRTRLNQRWRRASVPVSSYLIATEPLGEGVAQSLIPGGRMIVESRKRFGYYRISPDGQRLVFGGRAALEQISTKKSQQVLRDMMVDLFPALKNVEVTHSWTGLVAMTRDSVPHIARLEDGVYVAGGYNGSGVAMAPYLGHKLGQMIAADPQAKTVFAEIPLLSVPLYSGNPWFLKPLNQYYRALDKRQGSL